MKIQTSVTPLIIYGFCWILKLIHLIHTGQECKKWFHQPTNYKEEIEQLIAYIERLSDFDEDALRRLAKYKNQDDGDFDAFFNDIYQNHTPTKHVLK